MAIKDVLEDKIEKEGLGKINPCKEDLSIVRECAAIPSTYMGEPNSRDCKPGYGPPYSKNR